MGGGWFLFFCHLLKAWRQRQDRWARGLGLGGLAALVAGAFHALGEFRFHIPAFSLTHAAVAALTFLTVHHHQPGERFGYATWRLAGNRWALPVCMVLILIQAAYVSQAWYAWQAERAAPLEFDSTRLPSHSGGGLFPDHRLESPQRRLLCRPGPNPEKGQAPDLRGAQEIEGLLRQAMARLNLSARAYHRILKQ